MSRDPGALWRYRRERPWLAVLAVAWLTLATLALITLLVTGQTAFILVGGWLATVIVGGFVGAAYDRWRREGWVRPAHDGLWEGTRCILSVDRIRRLEMAGSRASSPSGTWLRLVPGGWLGAWGAVEVEVGNDAGADEFASALGLDPNGRVTQYAAHLGRAGGPRAVAILWLGRIATSASLAFFGIGLWVLFTSHSVPPWGLPTLGVALSTQAARRLLSWPCRVTVGADGIALRQGLRRARFLSFASIDSVLLVGNELTLSRLDGTKVHLWASRVIGVVPDGLTALDRRLSAALQGRRSSGWSVSALLARGGRSVEAWMRDLSRLGDPAAQEYRQPAFSPEALWLVVDDPSAAGEVRVAASIALEAAVGEEARPRLSVIASTCADARARAALEAVVSGGEPGVLAALENLAEMGERGSGPSSENALLRVADPENAEVAEDDGPSDDLQARSSFRC